MLRAEKILSKVKCLSIAGSVKRQPFGTLPVIRPVSLPPTLHYFSPPKHFAEMFSRQTFSTHLNIATQRSLWSRNKSPLSHVSFPPTLHSLSPPKHLAKMFLWQTFYDDDDDDDDDDDGNVPH